MKKIIWAIIVIVVLVLIALLVSNKSSKNLSDVTEIKIGSISILTGDGASWGEAARNGIDLAIKEINQSGGILGKQAVAIHEDDQGDPAKTVSSFRKLTATDNIDFIIGPSWSKNGLAIKDLIKKEIVISPSLGKAEFNESSDYVFNTWMHDYILSEKLAEYVFEKGYKNIALLGAKDVWVQEQTNAFTSKFQELGGEVSFIFEPQTDQRDVRTDLLKLKDENIEAVIVTSDGYGITSIFGRQMRELGINKPVYAITLDRTVISNCQGACDGWEYLTALTPTKSFEDKYKKEFNREVEVGADSAYDAVMMIAKVIESTQSLDTNKIQKYLNDIKQYEGSSGMLISDGKGGFTKEYSVMGIKSGVPFKIR